MNNILVLDEPSTGLHPSDNEKLLSLLNMLIEKKNSVIVIEHNLDIISQADWIIDMGPGPGKYGGKIIFEGTVGKLLLNKDSLTAKYLRDHLKQ
jgi:excinuclease UvrABC ATPase subunit